MHLYETDKESGFTVVEIMVAIVIFGILAAIAVGGWFKVRDMGNEAELSKEMSLAQTKIETYWTGAQKMYPVANNGVPVANDGSAVYAPEGKVEVTYAVTADRKDYCLTGVLKNKTFYFQKSVGEMETAPTC